MNEGANGRPRGRRQAKIGRVVSDRMDKTVVVAVERIREAPLYRRLVKRTSKFYAHDEENSCRIGDQVEIVSCRPLSAKKRWRVKQILRRSVEAEAALPDEVAEAES